MKVLKHRLYDDSSNAVPYFETPNKRGQISPEFLVIHYTAGRSAKSSINWLCDKRAKASAHLVIARSGEVSQLAAFNQRTWHAGVSRWDGRTGLNSFSIGIELDNPGILERRASGWCTTWGDPVDDNEVIVAAHKNGGPEKGWHAYSSEQIQALQEVCLCLVEKYGIKDIIGHDDIAPNRKSDPGPALDMDHLRSMALGRHEDEPQVYQTTANLNVRTGPGQNNEKMDFSPLPKGTELEVIEASGVWRYVDILDEIQGETHRTGWVHSHYISR
ncbi:N-acetylmuramoyl-L-alanine amidase [Terasakiella sp. A23]|uniref:N-acetylmuramoyl-L-alanine amidase n=1 Tax=Terasakiella sp. FCG-A23 TaxID=3080561 RepID=UPI002955BB3F|nr:N-acetylmuramoyl-L-alanine amidase [Terasakiella sp. A23]MDV7340341.1 N-acetylmuramoyl-L-alanine amidase [Terasakiella sp. A23]